LAKNRDFFDIFLSNEGANCAETSSKRNGEVLELETRRAR